MNRPCVTCGTLYVARVGLHRCPPCERARNRRRYLERPQYRGDWARRSRAARQQGTPCVRCGTYEDLTLDHETGEVECRSCNSSHRRNVE